MSEFEHVLYEVDGPVLTITLNRPEALNALSPDLEREFHEALDQAKTDDRVRSIIVTGAGRAFSAGYDISGDSSTRPRLPTSVHLKRWWDSAMKNPDMIMNVMAHPKPVIAAINGWCIGGGFWYSLACDVTISSDQATFGQPEVRMTSNTTVLFALLCSAFCRSSAAIAATSAIRFSSSSSCSCCRLFGGRGPRSLAVAGRLTVDREERVEPFMRGILRGLMP